MKNRKEKKRKEKKGKGRKEKKKENKTLQIPGRPPPPATRYIPMDLGR